MPSLVIPTPPGFRFWPSLTGHGWCDLLPYTLDEAARTLYRVHQFNDGAVVRLVISGTPEQHITVAVEGVRGKLSAAREAEVEAVIRWCFDLDRDMSGFYAVVAAHPRYQWVAQVGAGRLLSSPTVWEDLAKTLMTTNTTWNMTQQMVARLTALGDPYAGGGQAFPPPERIASLPLDALNTAIRAGYRGAYLHELAQRIHSGEIDVESWRDPAISSPDLYKRIKALKGFGDYAAGNLMRLMGHFDRLATDTECRAAYAALNGGQPASNDAEIAAYYEPFGAWRGLVQWMDVMESWFAEMESP
ncbi:MAG: 3-methyladenine DNA glycosylase [Anaerolineae bacterium]|nr:3-methyladenine DNA glycosylase [Anaerolineae bacterium]